MNKDTIKFNGYAIQNFIFERDDNIPKAKKKEIELNCKSFENSEKGKENLYRITLNIIAYSEKTKLNLTLDGFFEISKNVDEETKKYFLNISAPAIIYPYARTFISNVTAFDAGETIILPVINFADLKLRNDTCEK